MSASVHDIRSRAAVLPIPASIETEQAVLGALLLNNHVLGGIAAHMSGEDFQEPIHRAIFDVATTLIGDGKSASPITIRPFLGDHQLAEGVTVAAYLARLCAESLPPMLAAGHAQVLHSLAARRRLVSLAAQLDERARSADVHDDPAEIAGTFMLDLQQVAASAGSNTTRDVGSLADELIRMVDGALSGLIADRLITTGYADLDRAMNGYEPGTVVIAAGRPGMGKTMFANSSGYRCAKAGVGVLQMPLEIGATQLVARHLADMAFCGNRSPAFRDIGGRAREMDEDQVLAVRQAHARLRELPIEIDSRSRITLPQIAAKIAQTKRTMKARGIELGVVFIDHLDFIAASDRYRGIRVQEIGEIAIGLKDIARSQNVCVVLLCQLSREVEKRAAKDRRPTLADLRNSGDLEQVADAVMFLYREEYYLTRCAEYLAGEPDAIAAALDAKGKLEIILGKVRAGPTPTIHLFCDPASSSISSFERGRG